MLANQSETWERVCLDAADAHQVILQAIHSFERSLGVPVSEKPAEWRRQVTTELDALVECLRQHCIESENFGGLIAEMETTKGRSAYVTEVEHAHREVLGAAELMRRLLTADKSPEAPYSSLKREAAHFTAAVRQHQAREIDLVYETFWRDEVGGD